MKPSKTVKTVVVKLADLANELKCSPSTLSRLAKRGLPVRDRTEALTWLAESTTGRGGGWTSGQRGAGLAERAAALLGPAHPGKRRGGKMQLAEVQRRREVIRLRKERLLLGKLKGEMLPAAEVEASWSQMVMDAKSVLLLLPDKLSAKLAATSDPLACRAVLDAAIRTALTALSNQN